MLLVIALMVGFIKYLGVLINVTLSMPLGIYAKKSSGVIHRGDYSHTSGYWLIGTNAKTSWDSRYWGPIEKAQVLSTLSPLQLI